MKNLILMPLIIMVILILNNTGCKNNPKPENQPTETAQAAPVAEDPVQRGEYLINFGGCHDCHSPKENTAQGPQVIKSLMLSGYPADRPIMQGDPKLLKQGWILFVPDLTSASGPWGVSFSANLTPDPTGIGNWTEENFMRALKEGKFKGLANSRQLLPPMPWQNFARVKDEDIKALFAYLKSIPPVSNVVPVAITPDQKPAQQASPTTR